MSELVVFDTNVFVSYLLPSKKMSAVKLVVNKIGDETAILVFSDAIMAEYEDVLNRAKFCFPHDEVRALLDLVRRNGRCVIPIATSALFVDESDKCFYDAALTAGAHWLITGNKRRLHKANAVFRLNSSL